MVTSTQNKWTPRSHVGLNTYLMVRDGDRPPEDDPLHYFATRWGGQRTCVPVIAPQGRRQEVPEDERIQKGLLLCVEEERHNDVSHIMLQTYSRNPRHAGATSQAFCLFISREALAFGGGRATANKTAFPRMCSEAPRCTVFHKKQVPWRVLLGNLRSFLLPTPGNKQNTSTIKSLRSPAEKKWTWFHVTHPFPILLCHWTLPHPILRN